MTSSPSLGCRSSRRRTSSSTRRNAMSLPFPCPLPGKPIDWTALDYPWIAPMAACPQDPESHAEGDVWTHTRMVCEELVRLPEWAALESTDRAVLFAAALL